ncbi:MAG: hypothetical protein PVH12_09055 [Candidatus Bathyarchaeota archaeon]
MGKVALVTPLYISVVWILMISYQFFTETAVRTITTQIGTAWPSGSSWLISRIDMIVFIHAFAWVFLLSSAIPQVILGKGRSVLVQFFVCLTITFLAFIIQDVLAAYGGGSLLQILSLAEIFLNPFLAIGYLSIPYIFMLGLDIYSRRSKQEKKIMEDITGTFQDDSNEEEILEEEWVEIEIEDMQQEEYVN